jgi:hypothetical protein
VPISGLKHFRLKRFVIAERERTQHFLSIVSTLRRSRHRTTFSMLNRFSLLAISVLLAAIGLVAYTALRPLPPSTLTQPLSTLISAQISGWTVKDLPIAESEEMKKAVGELLNYDDAVYRSYTQGPYTITVYVAYWKPGKMSPRMIAGHTPDVCWINNGWKCTARDFDYQINLAQPATSSDNNLKTLTAVRSFRPAQAGTYEIGGNIQYVLFWHLHQGKLVAYNNGKNPPWYALLTDLLNSGLNQRGEQFFIRIASNVPMTEAIKTNAMNSALQAIGPLGLYSN